MKVAEYHIPYYVDNEHPTLPRCVRHGSKRYVQTYCQPCKSDPNGRFTVQYELKEKFRNR